MKKLVTPGNTYLVMMVAIGLIFAFVGVGSALAGGGNSVPSMSVSFSNGVYYVDVSGPSNMVVTVNGSAITAPSQPVRPAPPDTPSRPYGSCTVLSTGQQVNLTYFAPQKRLFLEDSDLAILRTANQTNVVQCHIQAGITGATVNAIGKRMDLDPGMHWFYLFPRQDPSLGFDAFAN